MAMSIDVSGNDVYVSGFEVYELNFSIAKYWKNGNSVFLTDGSNPAGTRFIIVSGNDIYVAGEEIYGLRIVGKYWKNGKVVSLTSNYDVFVKSMAISGK